MEGLANPLSILTLAYSLNLTIPVKSCLRDIKRLSRPAPSQKSNKQSKTYRPSGVNPQFRPPHLVTRLVALHPHLTRTANPDLNLDPLTDQDINPSSPSLDQELLTPSIRETKQPARRPSARGTTRRPLLPNLDPELPSRCLRLVPLRSPLTTPTLALPLLSHIPSRRGILTTPLTPLHLTTKRRVRINLAATTPPQHNRRSRQRPSGNPHRGNLVVTRVAATNISASSELSALELQLRLQTRGSPPRARTRTAPLGPPRLDALLADGGGGLPLQLLERDVRLSRAELVACQAEAEFEDFRFLATERRS